MTEPRSPWTPILQQMPHGRESEPTLSPCVAGAQSACRLAPLKRAPREYTFRLRSPSPPPSTSLSAQRSALGAFPMPRVALLILFWLAAGTCVLGQIAVVRDVVVGRAPATSGRRSARWQEITWAVLPSLGLIVVLLLTWHHVRKLGDDDGRVQRLSLSERQ